MAKDDTHYKVFGKESREETTTLNAVVSTAANLEY
jgi:hypothetical protein